MGQKKRMKKNVSNNLIYGSGEDDAIINRNNVQRRRSKFNRDDGLNFFQAGVSIIE